MKQAAYGPAIHAAIRDLASEDRSRRGEARTVLEQFGHGAVRPPIEALSPHDEVCRHEAFQVLGSIASPAAADALLEGLEDESPDCRWLAAEGLVALGREGLLRVLRVLTEYPKTDRLLRGAHHVVSGFQRTEHCCAVEPVLRAFLSDIPQIGLPKAARQSLTELRKNSPCDADRARSST